MPYEVLPHTADVRLRVEAPSVKHLFEDAVQGMAAIILPGFCEHQFAHCAPKVEQQVAVSSIDQSALLIDFLSEVLYWSQVQHAVFCAVRFAVLSETHLQASIVGCLVEEEFEEEIKAVTYHESFIRQNERQWWESIIVFDI